MNPRPLEMEGLTGQLSTISLDYEISGICEGILIGPGDIRSTSSRRYAMKYIGEFSRSDSDMFSISTKRGFRKSSRQPIKFFFFFFLVRVPLTHDMYL